nr:reverse transcriptase domain-containing protein, chloroplastic [Tanacetum cinerariifolium]
MRTRSQSCENFPQQEASSAIVEPLRIENPFLENQFQEDPPKDPPEVLIADDRTMAELLRAPTEGYEDAIVILKIAANNFALKHDLINLVQNKQFFRHDKEDPHAHIRYFNKITSTMRVPNVPTSSIKLMLFHFSLEGAAQIWLEKEAPRSILTWDDLVSKFINQFFPPSKTTNLCNEITRIQQRFNESFYEAWECFNDLLRACPHHGFSELHQLDTFYNALNSKSKVHQTRAKAVIAKVSTSSSTPAVSSEVADLKDMVRALLLDKKNQSSTPASSSTPAPVKAIEPNCVTSGGTYSYQNCPATSGNIYRDNIQEYVSQAAAANYNQGNTGFRPQMVVNQIRPPGTEVTKNQVQTPSSQSIAPVQPLVTQSETQTLVSEPIVAPVNVLIPYPSRRDNERRRDQANEQIEKFYEIFKEMRMDECLALADLGASINLMPLSVWEGLSPSELTPTYMTLELADRSVSKTNRRYFLKTDRALIDVHKGELTLRIRNEAITYNLDQTSRYSANYNQMTANKIDVIYEIYSKEVLGFSDVTASGNPTPYDDPIVSITSPTLTPFGDSDFLLFEEADAFLGLEDDPNSLEFNPSYYDPEGDILLLEAILNDEPLPPLPSHDQYLPSFKKELKVCEAKTVKSSVDEPPEVELKDLPPHLEYAFLEGDNKLPVIIAKELGDEDKSALIKVLKSHKRAIACKLSDIHDINLKFCTHKILMEEDYKPAVQHQRRVNPKIHDIIKKEVEKLLDAGLIYPISDSPWVSPMLERLAGNEYYYFLDGFFGYFQIPIDPRDQEKTTFTCPYGTFAYRRVPFGLCNASGTFQRCMLAIFHDMVEKMMEVFMDDFSVFGNSFENCLSRLDKMLQRGRPGKSLGNTSGKFQTIEYSQEVLGFLDTTASGNPTPHDDPIVSTTSPTLTPFGDSDFLLFEEADAFLGLEDDPNSPKFNPFYYDPKGDILLLEAILNSEPLPPLPNHEQYLPSFKK